MVVPTLLAVGKAGVKASVVVDVSMVVATTSARAAAENFIVMEQKEKKVCVCKYASKCC